MFAFNKEQFKQNILEQFRDEKSPIHYLMYIESSLNQKMDKKTFYCSEFQIEFVVVWVQEHEYYHVTFTEYEDEEYILKEDVLDITDNSLLKRYTIYKEVIELKYCGIKFNLEQNFLSRYYDYRFVLNPKPDYNNGVKTNVQEISELKCFSSLKFLGVGREAFQSINALANIQTDKWAIFFVKPINIDFMVELEEMLSKTTLSKTDADVIRNAFMTCVGENIKMYNMMYLMMKFSEH